MSRKKQNDKPQLKPILVMDLRAVESIHRESIGVDLLINGNVFRFEGRRLIPTESNRIKSLMEIALPPVIPGIKDGEESRYDFNDLDYKARHESARRNARALALWMGYACFKVEACRLVDERVLAAVPESVEEIGKFIETRAMDDDALQMLFVGLTKSSVELQGFVNFTSGSGSPKS